MLYYYLDICVCVFEKRVYSKALNTRACKHVQNIHTLTLVLTQPTLWRYRNIFKQTDKRQIVTFRTSLRAWVLSPSLLCWMSIHLKKDTQQLHLFWTGKK